MTEFITDQKNMVPKMSRFKVSKKVAKGSWRLLKMDKEILLFPLLSFFVQLILLGLFGILFIVLVLKGDIAAVEDYTATSIVDYASLFVLYLAVFFVNTFAQAGIASVAFARLRGNDLTFRDGFHQAWQQKGKIFLWSLLAATVGIILHFLEDRLKAVGKITSQIAGFTWNLVTFFIVPVLVLENFGLKESIRTSGETFKKTWGESIFLNIALGLYGAIFIVVGIGVSFVVMFLLWSTYSVFLFFGLMIIFILMVIGVVSALNTIFRVVLYEYAKTGNIPEGFSKAVVQSAVRAN